MTHETTKVILEIKSIIGDARPEKNLDFHERSYMESFNPLNFFSKLSSLSNILITSYSLKFSSINPFNFPSPL